MIDKNTPCTNAYKNNDNALYPSLVTSNIFALSVGNQNGTAATPAHAK
jgi:hypothetical protein